MSNCSCLFLCRVVRQCYGKRKRGLELGLYSWTTLEVCWGIRRMDSVPNAPIRALCGVTKGLDERIDGSAM